MKLSYYFITFLAVLLSFYSKGQILSDATLHLNVGGVIHDAEYDPYKDAYIVVGEFDSIQGQARKNLAFIDATTFSVTSDAPITSINGAIRTIGRKRVQGIFPANSYVYLYIGGDFTLVNGNTNVYLARFRATEQTLPPFNLNYNYNSWNAQIVNDAPQTERGVNEILIQSDTLIAVGRFRIFSPSFGLTLDRYDAVAFDADATNAALIDILYPLPSPFAEGVPLNGIKKFGDFMYIYGDETTSSSVKRFSLDGTIDNSATYFLAGTQGDIYDVEVGYTDSDTTVFISYASAGAGTGITDVYYFNGPNPNLIIGGFDAQDLASYKNYVFATSMINDEVLTYKRNGGYSITLENTVPLNAGFTGNSLPLDEMHYNRTHILQDKLFLSGENLTTADGQSRTGLAIFCLEPSDAEDFTAFDTSICEGNTKVYTIPEVEFATGYRWMYTGSGAEFRIATSMNVFQPLNDTNITNLGANSIEIKFGAGTTGGIISVQPYSTCNSPTDYLYGEGKALILTTAPLPDLVLVEDTMTFTCVRDSFHLIGQSATAGVSWSWEHNASVVGTNDSLYLHVNDNIIGNTYHHVFVSEPVNGCVSTDSVLVYYDTIATPILLSSIISTPPVFDCTVDSLTLSAAIPNATIHWALQSAPNDSIPGLFTIHDGNDSTSLIIYATYDANGCTAQQSYLIAVDQTTLPAGLTGYPNFGSVVIIDSLNCTSPILNLESTVTGNGTTNWIIGGIPSGNQLNLTVADSAGMNAFNTNSYQFITTNNDNGCIDTSDVTVKFDFDVPFVTSYVGPASLNCSAVDLNLVHVETGGSVIEGWLDGFGTQTNTDSLLITAVGEYYYQVESLSNGCVNTDTVQVLQTLEMFLDMPSDTTLCDGQSASVTPISINNTESTSYVWSNGGTMQTATLVGGVDTEVTVVATTISGCTAYDTIQVLINPPIQADFIASSGCADGAIQISNVSGGAGSYEYSLNQTDWQTNAAFTGLSFGTHTIYIQDALNCVHSFDEIIESTASGLDVNFLVSTYNSEGDTLAMINISNFTGFDSLVWIVPSNAAVYSEADSMIVLSILDGGWYDVTLIGYQDTCAYSFTKPVYFGDEMPIFEDDYDAVGIQSVLVYPNPTTGDFTVDVELGVQQNYTIVITNMQGQPMAGMTQSGNGITISEDFSFPFGATTGPYVIHIVCDFDARQETILLN